MFALGRCRMRAPLWWARLRDDSPRYVIWREILGSDDVPLQSPGSFFADLGDPVAERSVECYALDWPSMRAEQKHRLALWVAERFGVSLNDALLDCDARGYPIRAADVTVAFSLRAFI